MNREKYRALALKLALAAGRIQLGKFRRNLDIQWKGLANPVTEVDRASEALIVRGIRARWPGHAVLGEEGGASGRQGAEVQWIVDPLDGTVNYSHGIPQFCVSIGVYEDGKALVGVVHAPALGETFVAERGKGAFLNGRRIRVSRQARSLEALLSSGFSYKSRRDGENIREWSECLTRFQAIRRMGAAALDLCWVACGRYDGFWEYGLNAWDMAAGRLVIEEAGGTVTNIQGGPLDMFKPGIVASNGRLHGAIVGAVQRALKRRLIWPPR